MAYGRRSTVVSKSEIVRRITDVEAHLKWLDEHGTRGVDVIKSQLSDQAGDVGELKGKLDGIVSSIDNIRRSMGSRQTIVFVASVLPIYVLLIITIVKR